MEQQYRVPTITITWLETKNNTAIKNSRRDVERATQRFQHLRAQQQSNYPPNDTNESVAINPRKLFCGDRKGSHKN